VLSALLGALVVGSVENGMGLLGLVGSKFIITGLVLLAAVLVDALARRSRVDPGAPGRVAPGTKHASRQDDEVSGVRAGFKLIERLRPR
jgi:hypothetical protein